jgi:Ca-activated chloride channel family protein
MSSPQRTLLAVILAVVFCFPFGAASQGAQSPPANQGQQPPKPKLQRPGQEKPEPDPQDKDEGGIRLGTDLVILDVTVVDPMNKPVMNLDKQHFSVTEDKVAQSIAFFSQDQVPVSLVFTIDTSGSMRAKLDTVIKATVNLVKASKQGDELAVIEFKEEPELLEEFTTDSADVVDTLQGLVASRQTAMLDALYLAADYATKEGKNRRKAVIVVTDGLDKDSYYKFADVVEHLRETDAQIYLIGFTGDLDKESGLFKKSEKGKAEALLTKLAEETGGVAFYPRELSEVHTVAEQISSHLRTQYSISYYPTNSKKDGTFRSIKVQVADGSRKLIARSRNGRTAPRDGAPPPTAKP